MKKQAKKHLGFDRDANDNIIVHVHLSDATIDYLERLANAGIYGIGVEGVIEGFVYRGLQSVFKTEGA